LKANAYMTLSIRLTAELTWSTPTTFYLLALAISTLLTTSNTSSLEARSA